MKDIEEPLHSNMFLFKHGLAVMLPMLLDTLHSNMFLFKHIPESRPEELFSLHSNMFLFKPGEVGELNDMIKKLYILICFYLNQLWSSRYLLCASLHSNMFLFKPAAISFTRAFIPFFTFQYVSI